MFTLTIKSRDYIPFTIQGSASDLQTAVIVMTAGFQNRQSFTVSVAGPNIRATIEGISKATSLLDAVHDLIVATTPRGEQQ